MKNLLLTAIVLLIGACNSEETKRQNTTATDDEITSARIDHLVFLSLKDSLQTEDIAKFKNMLRSLSEIDEVDKVEVSERKDVGDSRALDYDILMIIEFDNLEDLKTYAIHPHHLAVRDSLMGYLAAPPATFDLSPE